jgi:hypothetical protein
MEPVVRSFRMVKDAHDPHIEYGIVSGILDDASWRRYNDFVELDCNLRSEFWPDDESWGAGNQTWPVLPPMKLCGNTKRCFVEMRREQLQYYLVELFYIPGVRESREFNQFLYPSIPSRASNVGTLLRNSITVMGKHMKLFESSLLEAFEEVGLQIDGMASQVPKLEKQTSNDVDSSGPEVVARKSTARSRSVISQVQKIISATEIESYAESRPSKTRTALRLPRFPYDVHDCPVNMPATP